MRKLIAAIAGAALLATLAPTGATGAPEQPQKHEGTVMGPSPGPNGETTGGCWTGWPRRFYIFTDGAVKETPFGSMFEIDESTWNGQFKLEVTGGGTGQEDLDLTFYADPGQPDPADPAQQGGIVETGSYLSREPGGESGLIPETTTVALVCMDLDSGYNATYEYTGTPPKPKKKKKK